MTIRARKPTDTEKAHVESTVELLHEVMESQRIPGIIAIAALLEMIHQVTWNNANTVNQFMGRSQAACNVLEATLDSFLQDKLNSWVETKPDDKQLALMIDMMRKGPSALKLKDGKIIGLE
jgi:hypothetical protein